MVSQLQRVVSVLQLCVGANNIYKYLWQSQEL